MEVEDIASTDTMVGAEGANVCVIAGKYYGQSPESEEDGCYITNSLVNTPTTHAISPTDVHMQ